MPVSDPEILPLLSRGRHRSPRKGACFMELAGFLAGERWSDHPACTHPLLARLARGVNDVTSDDARPRLAVLIPSVIGLTSDDPTWDHAIALVAASAALPMAPEERQRALAVGHPHLRPHARRTRRVRSARDPGPGGRARPRAGRPGRRPARRAVGRRFTTEHGGGRLTRHPGSAIVDFSVQAIAWSGRPDTDDVLRRLLADAVAVCRTLAGRTEDPAPGPRRDAWPPCCVAVAPPRERRPGDVPLTAAGRARARPASADGRHVVVTAARTWMWRAVYELLGARVRTRDWAFMNYGYAPADRAGRTWTLEPPLVLDPADEPDRLCIQLYARDPRRRGPHRPRRARDRQRPRRRRAVPRAVRRAAHGHGDRLLPHRRAALPPAPRAAPALTFRVGDAQATGLPDACVDVVVNVESSHCYGSMDAFIAEVHRVLRPGGHFVWADLRGARRRRPACAAGSCPARG